ncbi:ABC transporter permease [Elusimicrobiota bacterium]
MLKFYFERFKQNKLACFGLGLISALILLAVIAPVISPYSPTDQNLMDRLQAPSLKYIFGTDDLGRDVLSRMIYGIRVSLSVGFIAALIAVVIGTSLGLLAGYFGGWVDTVIMRLVDIMLCFPAFFLILIVIAFLEPSIHNVMVVIGITSWPGLTRLVRAEILSLREREFIQASRLLGLSNFRIFFVHLLPNVVSPIVVSATLGVGSAILIESGLSFLGLGVQPPMPSWGQILTSGKEYIYVAWWLSAFPGIAILLTVLFFNLLGTGLRDILDPKLTNSNGS